jgi:tetratricopeptide (TPR) repeat protein
MLAHASGDLTALERDSHRSGELFAALGDGWGRLQAATWIAGLAEIRGEYDRAAALHAEGLRRAEELALWPEVAAELSWLSWLAVQTGDYAQARELGERAHRIAVEQGSPAAVVFAELGLGFAARRDGKLDVATAHLEHLVEMAAEEEQPALYLPMVLTELGHAARQGGDPAAALALYLRAFTAAEAVAAPRDALGALVATAAVEPDPVTAALLLGCAEATRSASGIAPEPIERDDVEGTAARLRAALGEDAFRAAHRAGGALEPAEAIARAGTRR